jgi:hypothetical protein
MRRFNLRPQLPQDALEIVHGYIGVDRVRKQRVQDSPVMMIHSYLLKPFDDYRET